MPAGMPPILARISRPMKMRGGEFGLDGAILRVAGFVAAHICFFAVLSAFALA